MHGDWMSDFANGSEYRDAADGAQVTDTTVSGPERLCALADVPDNGAFGVEAPVHGTVEAVLLLRRGDEVRAYLNVCPHAGRRLDWAPGKFLKSREGLLVCAAHGASFELVDGACVAGPCRGSSLRTIAVSVVDGEVLLGSL